MAASGRLRGPTLQTGERFYQSGDRLLCPTNKFQLGVLNGDLATVVAVDSDRRSVTVRLDRDRETRELPDWYLDQGHVDYIYALTGIKPKMSPPDALSRKLEATPPGSGGMSL